MLWYNACLCITALFVFLGLSLWMKKKKKYSTKYQVCRFIAATYSVIIMNSGVHYDDRIIKSLLIKKNYKKLLIFRACRNGILDIGANVMYLFKNHWPLIIKRFFSVNGCRIVAKNGAVPRFNFFWATGYIPAC